MQHSLLGEFLGTMMLIVLGGGCVANVLLKKSKGEGGGWIVIATGWFVAVVIGVFVAMSAGSPNGDINPAVSFDKWILGLYSFQKFIYYSIAQIAGGFVGAVLVWLSYLSHWKPTENKTFKLLIFSTQPAIQDYKANFICEVIGTFVLLVGVGAIFGHATFHHPATGLGAYLVGVLVWGIGLSLSGPTGYAINPARDLGPRIAHQVLPIAGKGSSDWMYSWVPILGPLLGALLGALLWRAVF